MTVGRDYMLRKPAGPSAPKRFLNTKIVPLATNAAWRVERGLDRAAAAANVRPGVIVAGLTGGLALSLVALLRGRGDARGRAIEASTTLPN